jgi:hypothetical protein
VGKAAARRGVRKEVSRMGRMSDVKLVAGVVQMLLIRYDGCRCLGPLDACVHCELQMAREALERLTVLERSRRESARRHAEAFQSPLPRQG